MTIQAKKDYLMQARRIDERINAKLLEYEALRTIAERMTKPLTGMPRHAGNNDTLAKLADMGRDIDNDIDRLVEIKLEIRRAIKSVRDVHLRAVLESYYLTANSWQQVAETLNYSERTVARMHERALHELQVPEV